MVPSSNWPRHLCRLLLILVLISWSESDSVKSLTRDAQVAGTWDASFSGTVQGKGTSQTDTFVMELEQDGSTVKGTVRFKGLDQIFPVSGKVAGTTFSYTSKGTMGPNCEIKLAGDTIVDEATGRLRGSQTQANCEGTAVGEVIAVRR